MVRKRIELLIDLPCEATDYESQQWILFKLGASTKLDADNPLAEFDLKVDAEDVVIDREP